jgi:protoheme IX farnesyltransferase
VRFFSVLKPGIIFGNIVTVTGGFFLGSQGHINPWLLLITWLGMSLVIGSGCVINNYIDRDIDKLMERTKNRVLAQGLISGNVALLYAILLGILGFVVLYFGTNPLTTIVSFVGFFFYVVVYSLLLKRKSTWGTIVGGVAGAVPPVVGYCAVTNRFDIGAIILFLILFFWQMPHFYAIAIYRLNDYKAASIPILPIRKSVHYTKVSMLLYIAVFTVISIMPTMFEYTGSIYFAIALCLGLIWFALGMQGLRTQDDRSWARKMFAFSIINITVLSMIMWVQS